MSWRVVPLQILGMRGFLYAEFLQQPFCNNLSNWLGFIRKELKNQAVVCQHHLSDEGMVSSYERSQLVNFANIDRSFFMRPFIFAATEKEGQKCQLILLYQHHGGLRSD